MRVSVCLCVTARKSKCVNVCRCMSVSVYVCVGEWVRL
jgi:hypothetical protein